MIKHFHIFAVTLCVFFAHSLNAQKPCTCESNFEWMKKTFEKNDAGFQYVLNKKGQAAYDIHNQLMLKEIKTAKTLSKCTELLNEWTKFFRSGHISVEQLAYDPATSQNTSQQAVKNVDHEIWKGDISQFEKYIGTKTEVDYEGIWETGAGAYKVGIIKEGTSYIGFIIQSSVDAWKPGMLKLKMEQDGDKLKTTYFLRDHSSEISGTPESIGNNHLQIGTRATLKRLSPVFLDEPMIENYFKLTNAYEPYLEELNATTLYLRIPLFDHSHKRYIDNIISANKNKILQTENLIIDLRNNGGGSDQSYYGLLPLLYTNPIRTVGVEFLSTELNNQRFLDFATNPEYADYFNEEAREQFKKVYDTLQNRLGEFVNLSSEIVSISQFDTVYAYPKNVGIIINEGNASTTEQFLLAAKQSKKVKLFGTTTFGALDISNMHSVDSPCEEFRLHYCLSRSLRIPSMAIDDMGLQPDYYLDKTIPQHKWLEFVSNILNSDK